MHTVTVKSFGAAHPSNRAFEPPPDPIVGWSYLWSHPTRPNDAGGVDPDLSRCTRDFETASQAYQCAEHIRRSGGDATFADLDLIKRVAARAKDLFGYEFLSIRQALKIAWNDVAPDDLRSLAYQEERHTYPIWWSAGVACGLYRVDAVNETWMDRCDPHAVSVALATIAEHGPTEFHRS